MNRALLAAGLVAAGCVQDPHPCLREGGDQGVVERHDVDGGRVEQPFGEPGAGLTPRRLDAETTAALLGSPPAPQDGWGGGWLVSHDLVLVGGRVVDPETGLDRVCDVGIDGDSITAVGGHLEGATSVDVTGLVVAPGFVDLHSHAQTLPGRRLQACDGVTTALDLEAGRAPVELAYAHEAKRGSPIHYGFSASWAAARMHALAGGPLDGGAAAIFGGLVGTEWQQAASASQIAKILEQIASDLAAGAVGVGLLIGYTPGADPAEYLAVAELAATAGVPTFTHSRDIVELAPETLIDGAEEVVRTAGTTGAHMHYCHVNSTSGRHVDRVLALVGRCQAEGARVTTEAYPYGSGSTAIGAAFLAPERLRERFRDTTSITYLLTGERIADDARLRELRATDPGGLVIAEFIDESNPTDAALLRRSLTFPDAIVASDAMPPLWTDTTGMDLSAWPLPPEVVTHPRTAGTFGRALRLWRQEGGPILEAVRRATLLPARVLESAVPAMRRKGRVQTDTDADLVVFEEARVTDQATYSASTRPSTGIAHVIVGGTFVVRDGELVADALPGRPVRASPR
jgi:cytosine/adenosine deaminase-related metal-dependent hydrolase